MAIEVATQDEHNTSIDDDSFHEEGLGDGEEGTEYNFRELYDMVQKHRDVIFTIPSDQLNLIKHGLITRKSKDNIKMKNAGLLIDAEVLAFLDYPAKDKDGKDRLGFSDVRVRLRSKRTVTVTDVRIPDDL